MTNFRSFSETFRSSLSCMFTTEQHGNYDFLEANGYQPSHRLPQLELDASGFESLPESYKEGLKEHAYQALQRCMTPSKGDMATALRQASDAYTLDAIDARDTSNRPDTIPSDLNVIQVHSWEPEKRVFIPAKAPKGASLAELVTANTKPDGFMINLPERPIGAVLGTINAEAWRKGEAANIAVHAPCGLPPYRAPVRTLTDSEDMVAEWLAQPGRKVTTAKKADRLATLMARFWDKGDGQSGVQPIDGANAAHRALGRIAIAQRSLVAAQ